MSNKFTFRSEDARVTFKGIAFDFNFDAGTKNMSPFMRKIVQYCMDNNIHISHCYDINEINYFPNDIENIQLAFADLVNCKTVIGGYGEDNDIIIVTTDLDLHGLEKAGFKRYSMPFDCFMFIHMNKFTDELLSKHFDKIFHSFNGMAYTLVEYSVEVDNNEE